MPDFLNRNTQNAPWPVVVRPQIFAKIPGLVAIQTTRLGGVSTHPHDSLNLGINTNDHPSVIEANRERLGAAVGFRWERVAHARQVHGKTVILVEKPGLYSDCDALITQKSSVFLAMKTADCAPILLFDAKNRVSAAVHAGWRGAADGILLETIGAMQTNFGTVPKDCLVYIGPCIGRAAFEVGEEVSARFPSGFSEKITGSTGKFYLDLRGYLVQNLLDAGFLENQIEADTACTVEQNALYFSHRKEQGTTGRMAAIIGKRFF